MRELPSPNADARPEGGPIDMLVLHYTGMPTAEAALERLCDPAAKVSAHYLIDEDGTTVALVPERRRAWHAGVASWRGASDINARSIGVELVNPGHDWGYRPFCEAQYDACIALCRDILVRFRIPPARVLAHSDVAPERKRDPGELFDWRRLASAGIAVWPEDGPGAERSIGQLQRELATVGYAVPQHGRADEATRRVIKAFQRHFRPERVDGVADRGTRARLDGLLATI